jgi:CheY-like chemotaxis protein
VVRRIYEVADVAEGGLDRIRSDALFCAILEFDTGVQALFARESYCRVMAVMALDEYSGRCAPIGDLVNVGTKRQPRLSRSLYGAPSAVITKVHDSPSMRCHTPIMTPQWSPRNVVPEAASVEHVYTRPDARPDVLVADRNQKVVELVAYALERAGLRVAGAHDATTALAVLAARRPPVIVLDTIGLGMLELLRPASQHTAIIVLSALDSEDARAAAFQLGAEHYLTKPFSHRELVAASARVCCPSSATRQVLRMRPTYTSQRFARNSDGYADECSAPREDSGDALAAIIF